jgi:hypothetical protein
LSKRHSRNKDDQESSTHHHLHLEPSAYQIERGIAVDARADHSATIVRDSGV